MAEKKLSFNKLDALLKSKQSTAANTIKYDIEGETIEITVNKYIPFNSMMAFVDGVVDTVFFVDDSGETHYVPSILEYAKTLHYLEHFTNIKAGLGSDRVFCMLYNTTIIRDILKVISPPQYNHIEEAIDAAIEHRLAVLVSGEQSKLEDATDKIDQAARAFEMFTKQFEGFDRDKMQAAFNNLSTMEPKDLTGAIIDIRDGHKVE